MPVTSAKTGTGSWDGTDLDDVTNITVNKDGGVKTYASSSTSGNISRRKGHVDAEGSFTMKDEVVPFDEGDDGTLILKSSTATTLFTGTAIILNISYSVPIEAGDIVEATVTWGQMPY